MTSIRKLDRQTINSIAAGEVVERPASVVKELLENALDAGASRIRLSIEQGGIRQILCQDDGIGMSQEDVLLALESHATSKLTRTEDLFDLSSMGFRGEALPSIAAVSRLQVRSRPRDREEGTFILVEGGERIRSGPCGMPPGTQVICMDLFYNTPARYKFLRSDAAEAAAVSDITGKIALTRPDVSFRLEGDGGREILYTPGDHDLMSALYAVFGSQAASQMLPVTLDEAPVRVSGFVSGPQAARHNRARQVFIVNGRVIVSPVLRAAVDEACKTWFMKGRFPQLVLHLSIAGNLVDVNVHPQKTEMRFWDEKALFRAVYHAIGRALEEGSQIAEAAVTEKAVPEPSEGLPARAVQLQIKQSASPHWSMPQVPPAEVPPSRPPASSPASDYLPPASQGGPVILHDDISPLAQARLIGTFSQTYILLEDDQSLILIDQHAAHERVLYEELLLKRNQTDKRIPGQTLLVPVRLEVNDSEMALLEEEESYFQNLGFDYEPLGYQSVAIRSIPAGGKGAGEELDPAAAMRAALDTLLTAQRTGREIEDTEILHQIACKAAIKAHDRMSEEEIRILLTRLSTLTNPYHCPHGRPILVRLTQREIEKLFGRIV